jgi:hypothetical protein
MTDNERRIIETNSERLKNIDLELIQAYMKSLTGIKVPIEEIDRLLFLEEHKESISTKFYYVSFTKFSINGKKRMWNPTQGVINRHPFEFIKNQGGPVYNILLFYQEITEQEYGLYAKVYGHI